MSIATQNVKLEHCDNQNLPSSLNNLSMVNQVNTMEIEEDDDEDDVDFNPTWRGESPSEASSGLSSDNEVLGDDVGEVLSCLSKHQCDGTSPMAFCNNLDSGAEDEENLMQNNLQVQNAPKKDATSVITDAKELKRLIQQEEESTSPEGTNNKVASINENDATEEVAKKEFTVQEESYLDPNSFTEPVTETDDEDAICKRTRARHCLKNYTLEELEAFLQESDDDEDLQNVDEEKEYRKFLAAVLLGGDGNGGAGEDDNFDDDEENDADFAIEIEEALESDVDESFDDDKRPSDKNEDDVYRPETRQNKRLRESTEKKKCFTLGKMPLRPILPYVSNGQAAPVPVLGLRFPSPERFSCCSFSLPGADLTPGFTFQQLGQLFCLLHEHAQLLIQIFSISILDPSRQQVAMEVQELIMEMVAKHEDALARRRIPYNMSCFQPSNLRSSLHIDSSESSAFPHWTPLIDGSIFSIMDVAPLQMVKSYMADVSAVVSRHRQIQVEDQLDKSHLNKEPLFPFSAVPAQMVTDELSLGDAVSVSSKIASPLSPGQLPTRKSLAATLVENTKKQTVALVPMDIAKLAQRFYPLFNLALFPHKPPVPAVANRVLFTDAEDGLLAMGVMKYNSDWEAIQKHFLPCKSKHQIFVRQKNRSSSKAPDNPIKAVRRMKTSPLTADEKARICEGLKLFKQDWLSVWKFFVPHRDPSLLPRQWRIATGTQKSYRKSEAIKEKRRLYEARRRRLKASMNDSNTGTEKEVDNEGDDSGEYIDNEDEAYVHEAFLADSETGSTNGASYEISLPGICSSSMQFANMMLYDGTYASGRSASSSECIHAEKSTVMHELANLRKPARNMNPLSHCTDIRNISQNILQSNYHSSISSLRAPGSHLGSLPGSTRSRSKGTRVVKLAPGLPPINLPPSVRVISQSALQNHPNRSSPSYMSKNGNRNPSKFPGVAKGEISALPGGNSTMLLSDGLEARRQQDEAPTDQYVDDENGSQSDLQMHPLLFHASEDQFSSYYSMNRYTTVSSTYLLGSELQKETIVSKSDATVTLKDSINGIPNLSEAPLDLFSAGFHPLLRRTDNAGADFGMSSVNRRSGHPAASHHDRLSQESQCLPRENVAVDSQFPARVSTCHYDKENKLDLDIHLYSATEKEKTRKINDPTRLQCNGTDSPRLQTTMVEEGIDVDISIYLCNKNCSEVSASCGEDSNMLETAKMSDIGPSQCTRDYDESNLDIIMEQEELSDSDDESANVEFECEEIDDSEEDDSEYSRPKESLNKELPAASVRENNQDSCNLNHSRQPMSIRRELVHEDRNLTRQNLFHAKQSQSKPKHDNLKRDILSTSSPTAAESQFSKARNPKSSKMQLSGAKQYPGQPGNDCSKTVASRKPRKRSACK